MKIRSTYKFRPNVDIGSLDAENDKFLMNAFVEKDEIGYLRDIDDNKCIILGRTGSGKSALIMKLENNGSEIKRIDPVSMSLRHLSNSTIINYFKSYEVPMELFYKVLWRHVFIVEIIKLYYGNDISKSKIQLEWWKGQLKKDKKKQLAVDYLVNWEDKFWEETEYQIKEMESRMEKSFKNEIKDEAELYNLTGEEAKKDPQYETIKKKVRYKAEKVINESQVEAIKDIMGLLKDELMPKSQKKLYIVIDDLDKEWVANSIVYDLIKALIDTIKDLRKLSNLKIIIALRSNIHRKIFRENISRGVQREKYDALYLNLKWSAKELEDLINKRLKELMREKYTKESPKIYDIIPATIKEKSGFEYMLDRTFYRPRDIIDFFNKSIKYADGKTRISRENIREAENEYSLERLNALDDEWLENYGKMDILYSFLKNAKNGFNIEDIKEKAGLSFVEQIAADKINDLKNHELICLFNNY